MDKIRVVHYINQFFGGIGGEDKAGLEPQVRSGKVGPGIALQNTLSDEYEIVATIICGDNYYVENLESASKVVLEMIKEYNPQLFFAGPAFNAGRYGTACGSICELVQQTLGIPAITGVFSGSPAAEMYNRNLYLASTADSARGMADAVKIMVNLGIKIFKKIPLGDPAEDLYIPRGIRQNIFSEKLGAQRAVEMLIKKLKNEPFSTEYPMPTFDRVPPAPPVHNMSDIVIGLTGCGGIVPKGNPDRIEASSATKYGAYDITGVDDLTGDMFESAHGGYDTTFANEDPDRVLPVDVLRNMEKEGIIKKLHNVFYSTVGNGTSVENAKRYGQEMAQKFKDAAVNAAIVTSTWGTCTRCGATLVKEIERVGIPTVHIATVVPISQTVGANRIVPAVAIPYPLGDPRLSKQDEYELRKRIVEASLKSIITHIDTQTVFDFKK